MIKQIDFHIKELELMKKYPAYLSYIGNIELLKRKKVSIVGTRKPSQYTKQYIHAISQKLSNNGVTIVSGAAMGVDAIAHKAAGEHNTIAVAGTGLDIRYPAINKKLIQNIEQNGLIISQFKQNTPSTKYNFPLRNETVVALGEILIVGEADEKSGTMRSVEFAIKMEKPIYVLPHRIEESKGTQNLLKKGLAKAIYDIDSFISEICGNHQIDNSINDKVLQYFNTNPTYDEAIVKYPNETFEYELNGSIYVENGRVKSIK
jgi:DNA processing protein